METNKSLSKHKEIAGRVVLSLSFHSVFQRGRNMWYSGFECGGGREESSHVEAENSRMTLLFSPAVNNGRLVCPRKSLWLSRRYPRVERTLRKLFRVPHYLRRHTRTHQKHWRHHAVRYCRRLCCNSRGSKP